MKDFKSFITEEEKDTLSTYIANNLYRMGSAKNSNISSMLLLVAAAILNTKNDTQSIAAARRLTQLAMSRK